MKKIPSTVLCTPIFEHIEITDVDALLQCLDAVVTEYQKGEAVFLIGDKASRVGIVLRGSVQVVRDDLFGNRTILAKLEEGDLFGETFACAGVETLPVSVFALSNVQILLMDYRKVITQCSVNCIFHTRLIENMLKILAQKNIMLNQKIEVISSRSIREKLMTYLTGQAIKAGRNQFSIPFNRQELADYLAVDRSALSAELGRMRDDKVLVFQKNEFELLIK